MRAYSDEVRERVVAQWDAGVPAAVIAQETGMSRRHIRELVAQKRATGTVARRPSSVRIGEEVAAVLEGLRREDPSATRQQLAERLAERTGVYVSPYSVGERLKKLGLTYHRLPSSARRPQEEPTATRPTKRYNPSGAGPAGYPTSYFRRAYPSDLTDAQWELIAPLIPAAKPGGRYQKIPRRELVNGMLYVLHTGCPWRALPHDLPHWKTVYEYFRQWRDGGLWVRIVAELFQSARRQRGRHPAPSAAAMDAQSVATTEKGGPEGSTASSA
jgi:transposase